MLIALICLPLVLGLKNLTILGTNDVHGRLIPVDVDCFTASCFALQE